MSSRRNTLGWTLTLIIDRSYHLMSVAFLNSADCNTQELTNGMCVFWMHQRNEIIRMATLYRLQQATWRGLRQCVNCGNVGYFVIPLWKTQQRKKKKRKNASLLGFQERSWQCHTLCLSATLTSPSSLLYIISHFCLVLSTFSRVRGHFGAKRNIWAKSNIENDNIWLTKSCFYACLLAFQITFKDSA